MHFEYAIVSLDGTVFPLPQTLVAAVRMETENVTAQSDRGLAQDLGNRTEQLAASLRAQSQQLAARASQLCAGSRQAQQVCGQVHMYVWMCFNDV